MPRLPGNNAVEVTSFSEAGGHLTNEDAFDARPHPADPDCWICVLADGQGGRAGGAVAARVAVRIAVEAAVRQSPRALTKSSTWETILRQADRAVVDDPEAGFTTLLGFCIKGSILTGASSGDSAVLAVSGDGQTREVTKGQIKNPPVGFGSARFVTFAVSLVTPWTVLAMSDGVWKYVGWDRMFPITASPRHDPIVETLQKLARLPGSGRFPDDFTLVVFEQAAASVRL